MTISRPSMASAPIPRVVVVFLGFHCFVLAGYAIIGKGFAYLGSPPLYIGEIALLLGMMAALTRGALAGAIFNFPGLALLLLMIWTAIRTVPYLSQYGFDSLRDSVLVFYGLFSFIIASLILQWPATLSILIERYERFIPLMIFLAPVFLTLSLWYPESPGEWPLFAIKAGDISCHFAAISAFALVGFTRLGPLALITMLITALVSFTISREAMVSFIIGCFLAAALSPNKHAMRYVAKLVGAVIVIVTVAAVLDVHWSYPGSNRQIAVRQLVTNVVSIFGHSNAGGNEGTKDWRLMWWSDIIDYTVHGPYFWTGKGFGINLADSDGYQTSNPEDGEAALRSPHNAHMTILARAGVPGLILWTFALASWFIAIIRQIFAARQLGDVWWTRVFVFLLSFWTALVVSSSFDVAFEGPVRGIWFWTIHGIGLACIILHQHRAENWRRSDSRGKPADTLVSVER